MSVAEHDTVQLTGLQSALQRLAPSGVMVAIRKIRPGDENLLSPAEAASIPARNLLRRRASGAGRHLARCLLSQFGVASAAIPRAPDASPVWPDGFCGSIAHDGDFAVAAVGRRADHLSLGIDIEPAEALPDELLNMVVQPQDLYDTVDSQLAGRIVFCVKEAVYKAVFPLERQILNYEDVKVDLNRAIAETATQRRIRFAFDTAPAIMALAWIAP